MEVLQGRSARSDLPMSNAARKQIGIQPEVIKKIDKHEQLPTYNLHVGQHVMYQDSSSKQMVSSCDWKFVSWDKKLQDKNKGWCPLQENVSTPEALYTTGQEVSSSTVCVITNGKM